MKNVVFGYLFAGKKLRAVAGQLQERCRLEFEKPHRDLPKLKALRNTLKKLHDHLAAEQLHTDFETAVVLVASRLSGSGQSSPVPSHVLECARRLEEAMSQETPLLTIARGKFYPAMLAGEVGPFALLTRLAAI
jgi:hypothetical protein